MNLLKITFLLTCLTLLLVAMGSAIGGQSGMLIAFALACGMDFLSYWCSGKIILRIIASMWAMRSSSGGCVLKSFSIDAPARGLMKRYEVEGVAS